MENIIDKRIKLTQEDKLKIKNLFNPENHSRFTGATKIAKEFGVSKRTIQFIQKPERLKLNRLKAKLRVINSKSESQINSKSELKIKISDEIEKLQTLEFKKEKFKIQEQKNSKNFKILGCEVKEKLSIIKREDEKTLKILERENARKLKIIEREKLREEYLLNKKLDRERRLENINFKRKSKLKLS
jgi:hypothetical protein